MQSTRLTYLVKQYNSGALSPAEWNELASIIDARDNEDITGELTANIQFINEIPRETDERLILMADHILSLDKSRTQIIVHRVHFLRTAWFRYAAAILLILSGFFIYYNFPGKENRVVQNSRPAAVDFPAGSNRAVLTLSDGSKIELNPTENRTIEDGSISIKNAEGQLSYKNTSVVAVNTMTTPKGGQYQLTLSDGTKVWLNAASSITYPTAFNGNTRAVKITGEVYFEVNADAAKPFIVSAGSDEIKVLGTSFNINVYPDEAAMKTSLVEGSVKIGNHILQPGQAYSNGKIIDTNISQDIAWKNGYFSFSHNDVPYLMRQISRWYNINVKYAPDFHNQLISGKMERNLKLSEVMDVLEAMGVKYHEENNSIIIE